MYFDSKKCLLVIACCLTVTAANSATIVAPTVGSIHFSFSFATGPADNFGFILATFDDTSLSGGAIDPNIDHRIVTVPELINGDFSQTLSNNDRDSNTPDIGIDDLFILAVSYAEDVWIDDDPDCGSVKTVSVQTVSETNQYVIVISEVGGFDPVADVAQVHVPAAVWLFGSGLLGLVGVARRKRSLDNFGANGFIKGR